MRGCSFIDAKIDDIVNLSKNYYIDCSLCVWVFMTSGDILHSGRAPGSSSCFTAAHIVWEICAGLLHAMSAWLMARKPWTRKLKHLLLNWMSQSMQEAFCCQWEDKQNLLRRKKRRKFRSSKLQVNAIDYWVFASNWNNLCFLNVRNLRFGWKILVVIDSF